MRCTSCGASAAPRARYCDRCGAPLPADPASGGVRDPADGGDRRIVTALFADLVDYVRMVAEHDPEEVRRRIRAALRVMAEVIERLDGTREKFIGDAVFAVFGWPRAHDDDALRAALAALAIRASLRELEDGGEPLEVRVGIATGEVVTGSTSGSSRADLALTGSAITTAARIQSLARPGEILLDTATVEAARGRLTVMSRGEVVLRGQSEPVEIHALEGELLIGGYGPPRPRISGPIIGRAAEHARLRALLERCAAGGAGATVLVVGEAGIGKSRLLVDLESDARALGVGWTWTESTVYGHAEPYRFARVFAQSLADEHGVDSGAFARSLLFTPDTDEAEMRRFGGAIAAIARDAGFGGWEAEASHTPNDPAAVTTILREVAGRYVDRLVEHGGPRVVVLDDAHWMDPSSDGMIEELVARSASLPILVLAGVRPAEEPAWGDWPGVERMDLTGLSLSETAQLATRIGGAAVDLDDARRIHERTEGNPLFVTETVRAFLDDGTLARHHGRLALADGPMDSLPVTLRAVIGARIDALPTDAQEVLGVASIIGMRFERAQIDALREGRPAAGGLDRLVGAGLILPVDEETWRFSHPLVHDTAYAGLLTSRRRVLHGRIADLLEGTDDPSQASLIAVHRAASGDAVRAIPLLEQAADAALALGAAGEAAAFWRSAADLTGDAGAAEDYRARAELALVAARGS